jgi:hypothetical protein
MSPIDPYFAQHCFFVPKTIFKFYLFDGATCNSRKIQRFQCLRVFHVAAVGNLSLQGYPDIEQFAIIQFMHLQWTIVIISLRTIFTFSQEAITAFDMKTKRCWNGLCNALNVYVIPRSSRMETYRQRGTRIWCNFDHTIFRVF